MYACMYACMHLCIYVCMYACMDAYIYIYICMHVYMYAPMYGCMDECAYVFMHVRMYVFMYACMYVCMRVFILFIKHAPLLLHVSFICRGCSDQHHGVSHCVPFTILTIHHYNGSCRVTVRNIYLYTHCLITIDQSLLILYK